MTTLDSFARYPLTFGPSPVQRLERLTKHLGGAQIWAKREDVNSGLAFGGNKTRKLEYLVADWQPEDPRVDAMIVRPNPLLSTFAMPPRLVQ